MDLTCSKKGCKEIGTHHIYLELYPRTGSYKGGSAHLYFPEMVFCETHARELQWDKLIYPEDLAKLFEGLGQPVPDPSKTSVKLAVVQGVEVV